VNSRLLFSARRRGYCSIINDGRHAMLVNGDDQRLIYEISSDASQPSTWRGLRSLSAHNPFHVGDGQGWSKVKGLPNACNAHHTLKHDSRAGSDGQETLTRYGAQNWILACIETALRRAINHSHRRVAGTEILMMLMGSPSSRMGGRAMMEPDAGRYLQAALIRSS
jgi:hypothetical protein